MKWVRYLFVLLFLMIATITIASEANLGVNLITDENIQINVPFEAIFETLVPSRVESYTINLTLSGNIQLVNGNLQWQGIGDDRQYVHKTLNFILTQQGNASIIIELIANKISNPSVPIPLFQIPDRDTVYFYSRAGAVGKYYSQRSLDIAIRDSLVATKSELLRRRLIRERRQFQQANINSNIESQFSTLTTEDIGYYHIFSRSDTLNDANYQNFFTPQQIQRIRAYNLIYKYPNLSLVDTFMTYDWISGISSSQRDSLTYILKNQLLELHTFDLQIVNASQDSTIGLLLNDRGPLLRQQLFIRKNAYDTAKSNSK